MLRLLLAAAILTAPLGAQQVVSGIVHDSIVRAGGLSGAEVVVLGTSLHAITDDSGGFSIEGVMPGRHTLLASHPVLDTIGIGEIEFEIEVRAGATLPPVLLSTPTLASFQQATCGRELEPHEAIVLGVVSDREGLAAPRATISAQWAERLVRTGFTDQYMKSRDATTDAGGYFALCGVPREPAIRKDTAGVVIARSMATLRATLGETGTGPLIMLPVEPAVVRHDIVVGLDAAAAIARGRLLTEDGQPIAGARISRGGDTARVFQSDAAGRFSVPVPHRSEQLLVRAVGRTPMSIEFATPDPEIDLGDMPMPQVAQVLGTVEVNATIRSPEQAEFDERKSVGLGTFLDEEEIKRLPEVTPNLVGSRVPRSEMVTIGPGNRQFALRRPNINSGVNHCFPKFYVDGTDFGQMSGSEQEYFFGLAVRIEVYSAQFAPARFSDFNGCGSVVIWTR